MNRIGLLEALFTVTYTAFYFFAMAQKGVLWHNGPPKYVTAHAPALASLAAPLIVITLKF